VNRRLSAAGIPWQYETLDAAGEMRLDSAAIDGTLRTIGRVRVLRAYRLAPQAGATADSALVRLTDGSPWAVHGTRAGGGRYVVFASPLSTDATTLPTSAALLPLLDRLLGAWIASAPAIAEAAPGTEIALPPGTDAVTGPDGITESVSDGFRLGPDAGIYVLMAGDTVAGMIAANPPPVESDLTRVDARGLRTLLPDAEIVIADRPEQWRDRIFRERVGREVWRLLVLLAVLLLVAEAFVAATGSAARPKSRPRTTPVAGD
jgi:hypothetical protein